MKDRIVYQETYKVGAARIKEEVKPILRHTNGARVLSAEIRHAGVIDRDGKMIEFQDLRVYLEPQP